MQSFPPFQGTCRKTNEAVLTINAKTSRILVANRTACRLFNYKEEELCSGKKIYDLFTMEDGIKQVYYVKTCHAVLNVNGVDSTHSFFYLVG